MKNTKLDEVNIFLTKENSFDFLKKIDIENFIDRRYRPEFEIHWMNEFETIEVFQIYREDIEYIELLRELAFKCSFRVMSDSELSSLISDDFELICKSLVLGRDKEWTVTYLWNSYKNKSLPS